MAWARERFIREEWKSRKGVRGKFRRKAGGGVCRARFVCMESEKFFAQGHGPAELKTDLRSVEGTPGDFALQHSGRQRHPAGKRSSSSRNKPAGRASGFADGVGCVAVPDDAFDGPRGQRGADRLQMINVVAETLRGEDQVGLKLVVQFS